MPVDKQMNWKRGRRVYSPFETGSLITPADAGGTVFAEGAMLTSPLDVTVQQNEISTFGIVGITFAVGDFMQGVIRDLNMIDPTFPLGFRIHWNNSGGASAGRGLTWLLLVSVIKQGIAYKVANGVLNTVIAESLVTVAGGNEVSPRGILTARSLNLNQQDIEAGAKLVFQLEADVVDASVANVRYMGIEMDWVPHLTTGTGSFTDAPVQADGVR